MSNDITEDNIEMIEETEEQKTSRIIDDNKKHEVHIHVRRIKRRKFVKYDDEYNAD